MERGRVHPLMRFIGELMPGGLLMGFEMGRWTALRPSIEGELLPPTDEQMKEHPELVEPPFINPESTPDFIYEPLQHSGDLMDGYFLTMGFFYFTQLMPKVKELDERIRMGTSWIASNLIVSGVETGLFFGQAADPLDIPAGIAGSTLFLGARFVSKFLGPKTESAVVENMPAAKRT